MVLRGLQVHVQIAAVNASLSCSAIRTSTGSNLMFKASKEH
jgi:hypothetical protein